MYILEHVAGGTTLDCSQWIGCYVTCTGFKGCDSNFEIKCSTI